MPVSFENKVIILVTFAILVYIVYSVFDENEESSHESFETPLEQPAPVETEWQNDFSVLNLSSPTSFDIGSGVIYHQKGKFRIHLDTNLSIINGAPYAKGYDSEVYKVILIGSRETTLPPLTLGMMTLSPNGKYTFDYDGASVDARYDTVTVVKGTTLMLNGTF